MRAYLAILVVLTAACKAKVHDLDGGVEEPLDGGITRHHRPPSAFPRADAGSGPGTILFSTSGEVFSLHGYGFPPASMGAPAFVDGWEINIQEILVTIDKIALYENPDRSETDQSQTGDKVAQVNGPWAVDLHRGGPLPGKQDGGEEAVAIATIGSLDGGAPLDPDARYAVSYDLVRATNSARNINLNSDGQRDYIDAVSNQYVVYYIGTATWRGTASTCMSTDGTFPFAPPFQTTIKFKLGFKTPTTYMNCVNPDLPGPGIGSEEHPRGVQASLDDQIIAQLTFRTEQLFWENYDSQQVPLHFDQFAAVAREGLDHSWSVTLERTVLENYTAFPVPWRFCSPDLTGYAPPDSNPRMDFEQGRLYNPALTQSLSSTTAYRDYYDLASHIQSAQGYLNARGRCAIQRHFSSPP